MKNGRVCVIALGGNLGNSPEIFRRAVNALSGHGFLIRKTSSVLRTKPVDCPENTPDFSNAAVSGIWNKSAEELLKLCQKIEVENGRPAEHGFHTSRTLDLDIILFGSEKIRTKNLIIPHPRAKDRDFVKIPLHEIEPELEKLIED